MVPELLETAEKLREAGNDNEAAISDAHTELAQDSEFAGGVAERVKNLESPETAILAVGEEYARMFAGMEDSYMAARADDARDIARQIAAEIMGESAPGLEALERPSVILAHALAPFDTARDGLEGCDSPRPSGTAPCIRAVVYDAPLWRERAVAMGGRIGIPRMLGLPGSSGYRSARCFHGRSIGFSRSGPRRCSRRFLRRLFTWWSSGMGLGVASGRSRGSLICNSFCLV